MKMKRPLCLALYLLIAVGTVGCAQQPQPIRAAYAAGAADARRELREGHPCILVWGYVNDEQKELGLPALSAGGCAIDGNQVAFIAGHNETIRAHFQKTADTPRPLEPADSKFF